MEWPSTHISHLRALYPEILVLNWPQGDYNLCQIPCGSPKMERRGWGEREGGREEGKGRKSQGMRQGGFSWDGVDRKCEDLENSV